MNDRPPPGDAGPFGLPIGEAARRVLRSRGLGATMALADVLSVWEEVVGAHVAAHARPRAVHGGALLVEVDEPAWATQVQLLASTMLAGLSERLGEGAPRSLSVRVARGGTAPERRLR